MSATQDWQSLYKQSEVLVNNLKQSNVPVIERSLPQLAQFAENLRSRTENTATSGHQLAATRILAQQGFDANRLTQGVGVLESAPLGVEDVFIPSAAIGGGTVEEYLREVEESTLLAAIQESREEPLASFREFMTRSVARDSHAHRQLILGLIAPQSALYSGAGAKGAEDRAPRGEGGGLAFGYPPLIGRTAADLAPPMVPTASSSLNPKDTAYLAVVKRLTSLLPPLSSPLASASSASPSVNTTASATVTGKLAAAFRHYESQTGRLQLGGCWALLEDMVAEARTRRTALMYGRREGDPVRGGGGARGVRSRSYDGGDEVSNNDSNDINVGVSPLSRRIGLIREMDLVVGGRKHLEKSYRQYLKSHVVRNAVRASRGADPDPARDVKVFAALKLAAAASAAAAAGSPTRRCAAARFAHRAASPLLSASLTASTSFWHASNLISFFAASRASSSPALAVRLSPSSLRLS
mmetsp:Transcript_6527/g.12714  ORF Transcript_6527/g.12714 Transcript_6527/m.12714 type:complete len:469 (+) Transcript_6527:123-1529(+)